MFRYVWIGLKSFGYICDRLGIGLDQNRKDWIGLDKFWISLNMNCISLDMFGKV